MSRKERHEFIATLYEHSPHKWQPSDPAMFIQKQAELLMRYSATLHRLAEELCNGYQDAQGNWDEKRTALAALFKCFNIYTLTYILCQLKS